MGLDQLVKKIQVVANVIFITLVTIGFVFINKTMLFWYHRITPLFDNNTTFSVMFLASCLMVVYIDYTLIRSVISVLRNEKCPDCKDKEKDNEEKQKI